MSLTLNFIHYFTRFIGRGSDFTCVSQYVYLLILEPEVAKPEPVS